MIKSKRNEESPKFRLASFSFVPKNLAVASSTFLLDLLFAIVLKLLYPTF